MSGARAPIEALDVVRIWRYPVKSIGGEELTRCHVGSAGILGDRGWCIADRASGTMLTARRSPDLLNATARVLGDDDPTSMQVEITLPAGTSVRGDDPDVDARLSAWLGSEVALRRVTDIDSAPTYEIAEDFEDEQGSTWHQWQGPTWSFHDSARSMVSIVSTGTLRDWDERRFRINVIVDGASDSEAAYVERSARLGAATIDVRKGIDRCVMVTRPQAARSGRPALGRDLDVLRTIIRERSNVLGIGAVVETEGGLDVGDQLSPAD